MIIRGRVRGADGALIGAAALTLIDVSGRQVGRAVSEVDGTYHLDVPAPGSHVLIVTAQAHQPLANTVLVGEDVSEVDVVLTGTSGLAGVVRISGGRPISGAAVTLADTRGEVVGSRITGPDGGYVFEELLAGAYTLAVSAASFRPVALAVRVPETGRVSQDVELAGGGRIRGVVRAGVHGEPVAQARITLVDAEGAVLAATTTGADGDYVFEDVPEGDYTVIASGYPPAASALRVGAGNHNRHDVELNY
ncbi:hypothetical protein GCM10010174_55790 [Kutzneria viridogrisea]|uniref:Drug resistance transporter, EmrB/QacA subfamily n=2 Tax=Kutzneria TaxID=43356 RepID=W5W3Y9_9PSEU|nr:carboxypeptidase-like regulatory domain-containing protein [Kutzneria albida]AHH95156.1 drug resistance transporter, EmrB/QacA subfamily [Kutzneria albida DSM 43870]MBA8927486.1 acyl-coenzyme A thioesterase PaaI-like protein [Kutzneria viridogrisea]